MIKKLLDTVLAQMSANKEQDRIEQLRLGLLRHEAKVGGRVFGDVPKGHKRDFFCLDEHTWVWHEEWMDAQNQRHVVSTRYDVRPSGILKSQNGSHYQEIGQQEAHRLRDAVRLYCQRVDREVYNIAA
jgi:hypothetical protein